MFSFSISIGLLAIEPAISLHRACYSFTSFFISCYPMGLQANAPTAPTHFFIHLLLKASLAHFSHLYLFWALLANIAAMPTHFTASFLEFPWPVYLFFTSFTLMSFLLDSMSFLGLITISLSLITFWAYWPLSQPIEFTNLFPELPQPIYFFFISLYFNGLTTLFFGLLWLIWFFFTSFCSCGPASHQSCHFSLLSLFPYSFTVFPSSPSLLLGFFYYWAICQKMGINKRKVKLPPINRTFTKYYWKLIA